MGKFVFILLQLMMLMVLNQIGYYIADWTHIPIPGNVLGMMLLFTLLCFNIIKLKWIDGVSSFLIKHLGFFFVPISVGLMTLGALFLQSGWQILSILVISTFIGLIAAGSLSQVFLKKEEGVEHESRSHSI